MNATALRFATPGTVQLGGLLGDALAANHSGRLSTFIVDATSPAIALFDPASVARNETGDWYGEHAGKWLYAAARAAVRTNDARLRERVLRVAAHLVGLQDDDGYLGNYPPARRFMRPAPPKPESWDGAPALRTWDIWTHSYLMLGLIEAHRQLGAPEALAAACRIGALCLRTLTDGGIDITSLGNHHGLSATVLLDPALELHFATGEQRFLDLALRVVEQAERQPKLALIANALAGSDASQIATGKAYQLIWNLVGLAKLHRATGVPRYLQAVQALWENIRAAHLTLGGGPWGGVGQRSREVFNPAGFFSPYGYVETCSTLAWVQLNRELLQITGAAKFAAEIERNAYNDLIGAQAPNGEDWCYYSFPNGRRVATTYWRCCKSSGAMALEELAPLAYAILGTDTLQVNLLGPSTANLELPGGIAVQIEQRTRYPLSEQVRFVVTPSARVRFALLLRIPEWGVGAALHVNGAAWHGEIVSGEFLRIERDWRTGDELLLHLPMRPVLQRQVHVNEQVSVAPDGEPVVQQVLHLEHVALTRGPLVYATGRIDGFGIEATLLPPLRLEPAQDDERILLHSGQRAPLAFEPYFRAGGRDDGAWRITWLSLAQGAS